MLMAPLYLLRLFILRTISIGAMLGLCLASHEARDVGGMELFHGHINRLECGIGYGGISFSKK